MNPSRVIYVALPDEGVQVWRPVLAEHLGGIATALSNKRTIGVLSAGNTTQATKSFVSWFERTTEKSWQLQGAHRPVMYGLPKEFDASIFVEHELEQICFTSNTIHLVFNRDTSITLLASFACRSAAQGVESRQVVPVPSSNLMCLIGKKVVLATATEAGTLSLVFNGGANLTCFDDSKNYESYDIQIGDKRVIV